VELLPEGRFPYPPLPKRLNTLAYAILSHMSDLPALSIETIWSILNDDLDDAAVNTLVWHYLGYRWDAVQQQWDNTQVPLEWREDYPTPPDFIADRPPVVKLTRSIPPENKQLLKAVLGFQGYQIGELVPRKTRRATLANWLLSYMQQQEMLG
jgi:hypothetical protein